MTEPPPTVVYDCNVLFQAVLSDRGPAFRCLQLVEQGRVQLAASGFIHEEIRDVLSRPKLLAKYSQLTPDRVSAFLDLFGRKSTLFAEPPRLFSLPRDPKDEPYLNLALAVGARYLVTWNEKHLVYLMERRTPESLEFCARFPNLSIVTPPYFLRAHGRGPGANFGVRRL